MPPAKRVKRSPREAQLGTRSSPRSPPLLTTPFKPLKISSDKENQDPVTGSEDAEPLHVPVANTTHDDDDNDDNPAYSISEQQEQEPEEELKAPVTPARNTTTTTTTTNDDTPKTAQSTSPSFFTPASKLSHSSYNALKSHNGQTYTGMAVGGSHVWNYDPGTWKETKEEPDLWKIDFETVKRRAKNAPTGSGAPVGTEYHWLIVAHQYVTKTSANTYTTHLTGSKYKLARKNAPASSSSSSRTNTTSPKVTSSSGNMSWSIPTVKGQREREIELLEDAKRRVLGLPPVLASEKVRGDGSRRERGQMRLDEVFGRGLKGDDRVENGGLDGSANTKRKRGEDEEGKGEEEVEF